MTYPATAVWSMTSSAPELYRILVVLAGLGTMR
jgi:hypothetical protein